METSNKKNLALETRDAEIEDMPEENSVLENVHEQILNNISDPIYLTDHQHNLVFANDAGYKYLNQRKGSCKGKCLASFTGEKDDARLHSMLETCLSGETISYSYKTGHQSSGVTYLHNPNIGKGGTINGVITTVKNVQFDTVNAYTHQKYFDDSDKHKFITHNSWDVIWILNITKQELIYISPSIKKLLGYTPEEAMRLNIHQALAPQAAKTQLKKAEERLATFKKNPYVPLHFIDEIQQKHKNGRIIWVETSYRIQLNKDHEVEVVGISRNISQRKCTENALKESQHKYKTVLNNVQEGIFVLQGNRVVYTNPCLKKITGFSKEDIAEYDFINVIYEEDQLRVMENHQRRLMDEHIPPYDIRIKCKDGKIRWFRINASKIQWEGAAAVLVFLMDIHDRKTVEEYVRESEIRLNDLLANVPGVIFQFRFVAEGKYRIEFISKGAEALFETTDKELLEPEILFKNIHPDDIMAFKDSIAHAYTDLTPWFNESRIIVNGKVKWIRAIATSSTFKDEDVLWNGVLMDVTKEKSAAIYLKNSKIRHQKINASINEMLNLPTREALYQYVTKTLHEQYPDAAVFFSYVNEEQSHAQIINIDGLPSSVFQNIINLTGPNLFKRKFPLFSDHLAKYKSGTLETFDHGFADFVGPAFPSFMAKSMEKLLNVRKIHAIGMNKDNQLLGIIYLFSKNPSFETDSLYIESFVRQACVILEKKIIEDALTEREKTLRTLVENQGEGVGITNTEEIFTYANPAGEKLFGVGSGELTGKSLKSFLSEDALKKIQIETGKRKNGVKSTYELEIIRPDGSVIPLLVTVTPQLDENSNFIGSFGVFRDMTLQKQAEKKLVESNNAKDKLFSIIAHDLKNPVSNIMGFSELIHKNFDKYSTDKIRIFNSHIYKSSSSLAILLDNLLLWSRSQRDNISINPVFFSINDVIKKCKCLLHSAAQNKGIEIRNEIEADPLVYADKVMITTVLRNLISNAIKFTENGSITILANEDKQMVTIGIQDTGIGMTRKVCDRIFRLSENHSSIGTSGEKGTGMGLIICKEFMGHNNGEIWAESTPGKGSTFYITIPQTKIGYHG